MQIYVCIDDTDNIESRGTGELASMIAQEIVNKGWGTTKGVTRHQLFIHTDIPYTSHNSSMCFEADISEEYFEELIKFAADFLKNESAEGSDPGLCIAISDKISNNYSISAFGIKAKEALITKEEAYALAEQTGIHLSEHGGTGQGIIGALAGVGLRMNGNDGRFKGKIKIETENGKTEVGYILLKTSIERVKDINGGELLNDEMVIVEETLKAVLLDNKSTLLVFSDFDEVAQKPVWKVCSKQQLKKF